MRRSFNRRTESVHRQAGRGAGPLFAVGLVALGRRRDVVVVLDGHAGIVTATAAESVGEMILGCRSGPGR